MYRILSLLIVVGLLGTGCTALKTFPQAARAGETITLAVGSPDGMTRANTTATFTSDIDGIPVDITANIRSIFKLYADKASSIYQQFSPTTNIVSTSGHEPWVTIVALDLPTGLMTGPGKVQFNTTATYPTIGSHINSLAIALEILPGTGTPSIFTYELGVGATIDGNLADLEAQTHAVVGPQFPSPSCPCPDYGAIEIKMSMPNSLGTALEPSRVRVLTDDMTMETGSSRGISYGLNGQDLTVIITSPTGKLKYYEARFSVVLQPFATFSGAPTITSVRYFDVNGNETVGPVSDYVASLQ